MIADATDLPVNADLENCGADDPKTAAKAIARAAEAGDVPIAVELRRVDVAGVNVTRPS
jgi:2-methylisocitrate lyase-like PEP mutase family enzyme